MTALSYFNTGFLPVPPLLPTLVHIPPKSHVLALPYWAYRNVNHYHKITDKSLRRWWYQSADTKSFPFVEQRITQKIFAFFSNNLCFEVLPTHYFYCDGTPLIQSWYSWCTSCEITSLFCVNMFQILTLGHFWKEGCWFFFWNHETRVKRYYQFSCVAQQSQLSFWMSWVTCTVKLPPAGLGSEVCYRELCHLISTVSLKQGIGEQDMHSCLINVWPFWLTDLCDALAKLDLWASGISLNY